MLMKRLIGSALLLAAVGGAGVGMVAWKSSELEAAQVQAQNQPEPMEAVTIAHVRSAEHRRTTTSIGTVLALRSVTLRNELAGTVSEINLTPGAIVEENAILVKLDTAVEDAELQSYEAQKTLADSLLRRSLSLKQNNSATQIELDRAQAEYDVAAAQVARVKAIIERKTIRAPFKARVGISDIHKGQYLQEGTQLTTLQGVADSVHVDFAVPQWVVREMGPGDCVDVFASAEDRTGVSAKVVAIDSRIDSTTRNAMVRVRVEDSSSELKPGASVRVRIPVGDTLQLATIPVSALRKGPAGDQVYVVATDEQGNLRAQSRIVRSGSMVGDDVLIYEGLKPGEQVAASGSFKLFDGIRVANAAPPQQPAPTQTASQ